jgi:RHS repeat-associated protein
MELVNQIIASQDLGNVVINEENGIYSGFHNLFAQKIGDKRYELANHLGNVLEVITDRKLPIDNGTGIIDYYSPDVISQNDYYPFGMLLPNRHESSSDYRYGFQGQEMDDEIKGERNSVNYKYRMHDPRIGRFFAVDPLTSKYPELTPYQFSSNTPIGAKEFEGLEAIMDGMLPDDERFDGAEEINQNYAEVNAMVAGAAALVMVEIFITKGAITKQVLKNMGGQYTVQFAIGVIEGDNMSTSAINAIYEIDIADAVLGVIFNSSIQSKFIGSLIGANIDLKYDKDKGFVFSSTINATKNPKAAAIDLIVDIIVDQITKDIGIDLGGAYGSKEIAEAIEDKVYSVVKSFFSEKINDVTNNSSNNNSQSSSEFTEQTEEVEPAKNQESLSCKPVQITSPLPKTTNND